MTRTLSTQRGMRDATNATSLAPSVMGNQPHFKIIEANPIGDGIDAFRGSFTSICDRVRLPCVPDALDQLEHEGTGRTNFLRRPSNQYADVQDLTSSLLSALQILPATRLLPSKIGHGTLRSDLLRLISTAASAEFNFDRVKSLLKSALINKPNDTLI